MKISASLVNPTFALLHARSTRSGSDLRPGGGGGKTVAGADCVYGTLINTKSQPIFSRFARIQTKMYLHSYDLVFELAMR